MPIYDTQKAKRINGYLEKHEDPLIGSPRFVEEFIFIMGYAQRTGGPILELACGAGRVMRAVACMGFDIYGIDASRPMLEMGMRVKQQLPQEMQDRMHVIQSDMRSFKLNRMFPLIIIPFSSFWYNLDHEGAVACLRSIMSHLTPKGFFLIDAPKSQNSLSFFPDQSKRLGFDFTTHEYAQGYGSYLVGWHSIDI